MTAIVLRTENGKPHLEGEWPDETLIMDAMIKSCPYISLDRGLVVFSLANADAVYKPQPADSFGRVVLTKVRASRRIA